MKDAITVDAILGPHAESMIVVRVNPFELYAADTLHSVATLTAEETASAAMTSPKLEWKPL